MFFYLWRLPFARILIKIRIYHQTYIVGFDRIGIQCFVLGSLYQVLHCSCNSLFCAEFRNLCKKRRKTTMGRNCSTDCSYSLCKASILDWHQRSYLVPYTSETLFADLNHTGRYMSTTGPMNSTLPSFGVKAAAVDLVLVRIQVEALNTKYFHVQYLHYNSKLVFTFS